MKLVDLKRSKEERETSKPVAAGIEDRYPYGTRLSLDHDELEKLGMKTPNVGDQFHVHGHANVTSVEERTNEDGKKHRHVSLQIKKMAVKPHKSERGRAGGRDAELQEGGKAAMDEAIQGQQAADAQNASDDDS